MTASLDPLNTPSPCQLYANLLALLPKIRTCAFLYFRHISCQDTKADKVAETIALACYADRQIMQSLRTKSSQAMDFLEFPFQSPLRLSP